MVYSVQGGAAPCEGPDLANEGVSLQYSTNGGATWITIVYYSPGGFELPIMPNTSGSVASWATTYTTAENTKKEGVTTTASVQYVNSQCILSNFKKQTFTFYFGTPKVIYIH